MKTRLGKVIILIFFLLLVFFIISKLCSKNEHFISDLMVTFPLKSEIENLFINTNYFKNLNEKDKITRNLQNKNIIAHYLDNTIQINQDQKKKVRKLLIKLIKNLHYENKKQFLLNDWNLIFFKNLENNYPHTHSRYIMLPIYFIDNWNTNTVIHEKVHVFQRTHKSAFFDLYTNYWHFKPLELDTMVWDKIISNSRSNPDTENLNWVFSYKGINIVLLALYNDTVNNIGDVNYYGIYLDDNLELKKPIIKKKLSEIPEYNDFFGNMRNNNYHPNEISAEIIANQCTNNINSSLANSSCYKKFRHWWIKML